MVMEKTRYDALQNKLNILKKNREILSEEELQGRYAKSYNRLKSEIYNLLHEMQAEELAKIHLPKNVLSDKEQEIKDCYIPYLNRFKDVAFSQYDVKAIMNIWEEFQLKMINEFGATIDISYLMDN